MTEEPSKLQSMGSQESDTTQRRNHHLHASASASLSLVNPSPNLEWRKLPKPNKGNNNGNTY